jgi:predicted RNA binding protein YcfA (HicA-like mRNA interferase family)
MPKLAGIPHQRAVRAFEKAGFRVIREGKHISMVKDDRIIIIPRNNPINAFTMGGIIKDAGLTIEEFKKLL